MAIRVIFPIAEATIFGFPDSVRVTNRELNELKRLNSFEFMPSLSAKKSMKNLIDKKLSYVVSGELHNGWYRITRLGARVLKAIDQGTFQSVG